ncbi:MAG: hypothetical protein AAGE84_30755 [Cyanobacteria bacterium P01_G01_bin.39]
MNSKGTLVKGRTIAVHSKLSIIGTSQKHIIENTKFSDAGYWWLGHEISDFLDLELQVISQTPVIPPEPEHTGCC